MKTFLTFIIIVFSSFSFAQSKKVQIELLNKRVDSLSSILKTERNSHSEQVSVLNSSISRLQSQLVILNSTIEETNKEISSKTIQIQNNHEVITGLKNNLKIKEDSLSFLLSELEKLKPSQKEQILSKSNLSNQNIQIGGYKTVKIGTQVWMTNNLDVSTFRNGDPILEAKTDEEWKKAGENQQPAWCYYNKDAKNGTKYGKLYNWFAVNDSRGLAPEGYHIPADSEWTILTDNLGGESEAGKKMKSTSGWMGYGCKRCDGGSSQFKANCISCKGTQENSTEPFSGNGTNASGFLGLPGGYRYSYGTFHYIGYSGYWWSSSVHHTAYAWYRGLGCNPDNVNRNNFSKTYGLSVRCLRD